MACLTYAVIRGEEDLIAYCEKRGWPRPQFVESFAHNIPNVVVELIYDKAPTDEGYHAYYIMSMPTTRETGICNINDIRTRVHESIKTGTIDLLDVRKIGIGLGHLRRR